MTPWSHGRLSRVASASRNSMYLLTPAFFAFAMAMARLPESMSVPRMRYSPRNSAARAASRACVQTSSGMQDQLCAANLRASPGARFSAASAASMTMVPEPQNGSQKKSRPR